jgi:hypothetical protein
MDNIETTVPHDTVEKYLTLISAINGIEKRLGLSDLVYLSLNVFIILFTGTFISVIIHIQHFSLMPFDLVFILGCLVIGMTICVYWTSTAIRIQLKLKLRYFQARFLERRMDCVGEYILSDEDKFFDTDLKQLESPDRKESLYYPTSGLTRMDGFVGKLKPRYLSWLMPIVFFIFYWIIFVWVVIAAF